MNFIKMKKCGSYRGSKYQAGTIIPVGIDLANRIITNGQGSKATEEDYKKQLEEKNFDFRKLNREKLEEYAISINLTEDEIKDAKKKEDLVLLVENKLKEEA